MYSRLKSNQLIDFIEYKSKDKPVLILSGARQVGKTTLIKQVTEGRSVLFLNLEEHPSVAASIDACAEFDEFADYLREEFQFDPDTQILVIDEAQTSRKLGSFVRFMKENWKNATVILTGSVISELHGDEHREPVGRESYLELWPMMFTEFLRAVDKASLARALEKFELGDVISTGVHQRLMAEMDNYIRVGGLPEVVKYYIEGRDWQRLRRDIFKTYENDFARYFSLDDVNLFSRCLDAVAVNVGSPSKDTQAVRLDAPGYKKVSGIFSRLEKWKLIIKCEQLRAEPAQNKSQPKRYLYDVGVLVDLRLKGLQTLSLSDLSHPVLRTPLGGIIENHLALSLRDQFSEVCGFKLSTQSEIDFVVKHNDIVYPIECKIANRFKANHLSAITTYLARYSTRGEGFLFYGGEVLKDKLKNCHVLPYYLIDQMKRLIGSIGLDEN